MAQCRVRFFFFYLSEMSEGNEGRPGQDRWSVGEEGVFVAVKLRINCYSVKYSTGDFTHHR